MPAKDLGVKHACFKCGTKFYDMKKLEPLCPKCGADQRERVAQKAPSAEKRIRPPVRPAVEPEKDVELETETEPDEELDDSDEALDVDDE